jgi:hypothetical protein
VDDELLVLADDEPPVPVDDEPELALDELLVPQLQALQADSSDAHVWPP